MTTCTCGGPIAPTDNFRAPATQFCVACGQHYTADARPVTPSLPDFKTRVNAAYAAARARHA